jgi:hypothetical protein
MIESLKRPPGALRWAPRQRFALSPAGMKARAEREQAIAAARTRDNGREMLDAALADWARPLKVEPGDGVYLEEFSRGPLTVAHVTDALADCGAAKPEVQAAADRLFKAGLLDADPPAPPPRTPEFS